MRVTFIVAASMLGIATLAYAQTATTSTPEQTALAASQAVDNIQNYVMQLKQQIMQDQGTIVRLMAANADLTKKLADATKPTPPDTANPKESVTPESLPSLK